MAVLKVKPERIVDFFLGMMEREVVLPRLTTPVPDAYFKGSFGDTVNLRIRGAMAVARDYEWRTRTAPIQFDDIAQREDSIPVKLDTQTVSATKLTAEHYTLDEINFATEVLAEQVQAVDTRIENRIATGLKTEPFKNTVEFTDSSDPLRVGAEAKRVLNSSKVAPKRGRFFLVGAGIGAHWEVSRRMTDYSLSGPAANTMFAESIIGRLQGIPVIQTDLLAEGEGYLLHPTWAALANVAPELPPSIKAGARAQSRNGFAVTWLRSFIPDYLSDASIVHTFHGLTGIRDERQMTGQYAGDLLDEGNVDRGKYNVRGVKLVGTGFGEIDTDYEPVRVLDVGTGA